MTLDEKVRETIQKYKMLSSGDGVLVAVSGGPDSVALVHLLSGFGKQLGLRLEVAHLQHGIRGEDARQDAQFVAELAKRLALPFHLKHVDLPGMRSQRGMGNLEAMAREERYRFFNRVAVGAGVSRIATGHTRDDQVETLLMWLLRGSGRKGLSGMPPVRKLAPSTRKALSGPLLIHPLIEVSKKEIVEYLTAQCLAYRTDRTNLDSGPLRNWLRLHLLPQLRERINPGLDERLAQMADLLRQEEKILEQTAREHLQRVVHGGKLQRELLLKEDKAMQRRIIRSWLEAKLGDLRGIGFDHVEDFLKLIAQGPPQGCLSVPRGWNLVRTYDSVRLVKGGRKGTPVRYTYALPHDAVLFIPEARIRIQSSRTCRSPRVRRQGNREAVFDLSFLPGTLEVRNFREGDRFQPLGMQGHKKVKDLFIEKRVPQTVRRTLPLLLARGEILWVPGYARSEIGKVRPETKKFLWVRLAAHHRSGHS
ncbi:MAG: tRNA lysidine(34) synthetase TilS [Candidatus Binatia bacterium]